MESSNSVISVQGLTKSFGEQPVLQGINLEVARGEIIATLDADLQNDPADLPRLLAALDEAD